jgi:hypothetical protein
MDLHAQLQIPKGIKNGFFPPGLYKECSNLRDRAPRHSDFYPKAQIRQRLSKKAQVVVQKNASQTIV